MQGRVEEKEREGLRKELFAVLKQLSSTLSIVTLALVSSSNTDRIARMWFGSWQAAKAHRLPAVYQFLLFLVTFLTAVPFHLMTTLSVLSSKNNKGVQSVGQISRHRRDSSPLWASATSQSVQSNYNLQLAIGVPAERWAVKKEKKKKQQKEYLQSLDRCAGGRESRQRGECIHRCLQSWRRRQMLAGPPAREFHRSSVKRWS